MRFLLSIQGSSSRLRMEAVVECIIQPLVHETLANADHRVTTHLEGLGDLFIGPAGTRSVAIDLEKYAGMGLLANWRIAFGKQLLQDKTLFFTQFHFVLM